MARKPRRIRSWFERIALGGIMTVVAFVVERRLLKVIRQRGKSETDAEAPETNADATRGNSAELTTPTS
ncbi:MAG: hypothetical protein M3135_08590 [Actinomycetota bacterium]|nr:hypothetical protein [Actinomycetota bacterium]